MSDNKSKSGIGISAAFLVAIDGTFGSVVIQGTLCDHFFFYGHLRKTCLVGWRNLCNQKQNRRRDSSYEPNYTRTLSNSGLLLKLKSSWVIKLRNIVNLEF